MSVSVTIIHIPITFGRRMYDTSAQNRRKTGLFINDFSPSQKSPRLFISGESEKKKLTNSIFLFWICDRVGLLKSRKRVRLEKGTTVQKLFVFCDFLKFLLPTAIEPYTDFSLSSSFAKARDSHSPLRAAKFVVSYVSWF